MAAISLVATVLVGTASAEEATEPRAPSPISVSDERPSAVTSTGSDGKLAITESEGDSVSLKMAGVDMTRSQATSYGSRVDDAVGTTDLIIEASETGFAVIAELEDASANHELRFDAQVPDGTILQLTDEGAIDVIGMDGTTVGTFETPWALDAKGNPVKTFYEIDGSTIVQHVDRVDEGLYPILADPKFTWGWVSGTMYLSKFETQLICAYGVAAFTWIGVVGFWLSIVTVTLGAIITGSACAAAALNKCIKVKSYGVIQQYSGGYCT